MATNDGSESKVFSLRLVKGARDRIGEDNVASLLLIQALAKSMDLREAESLDLKLRPDLRTKDDSIDHLESLEVRRIFLACCP